MPDLFHLKLMVVWSSKVSAYILNVTPLIQPKMDIRSYSGPHFPAFGLNTEKYGVSLRIHSECAKIRTRITPNTDTFHAVLNGKIVHIFK